MTDKEFVASIEDDLAILRGAIADKLTNANFEARAELIKVLHQHLNQIDQSMPKDAS